jgi:ubiquinone/menaquinone biosynthesis C-methylase UbiE
MNDELIQKREELERFLGSLPTNAVGDFFRAFLCIQYYIRLTAVLDNDDEPTKQLINLCDELITAIKSMNTFAQNSFITKNIMLGKENIKIERDLDNPLSSTAAMYGKLFPLYDDQDYKNEALILLKQRLEKNNIPLSLIRGKKCLDTGCGGGRYSIALAELGADSVFGIDAAKNSIGDAKKRAQKYSQDNCTFSKGNILELPFENDEFDFIFSYGVLHHTTDPEKGIRECYRVLKKGGNCFLFVMSGTGLFYQTLESIRRILKDVSTDITRSIMQLMGFPGNKIFNVVDLTQVPIQHYYSQKKLETLLNEIGFSNVRRLKRDSELPTWVHYNEKIYQEKPFAREKYGIGDHKYIIQK